MDGHRFVSFSVSIWPRMLALMKAIAPAIALLLAGCSAPALDLERSRMDTGLFGPKVMVLTIDDAPGNLAADAAMLATLAKHDAKAIWFVNCKHLETTEQQAMLRRFVAEGHEIGNHGWDHVALPELSGESLHREIAGCADRIEEVAGVRPRFHRGSFGETSPEALQVIREAGMEHLHWSLNSWDAVHRGTTTAKYAELLSDPSLDPVRNAEAGDVYLLHDHLHSAELLDGMLADFSGRGFRFVLP
jgi:peptidoglycan-N-acetylglucosamine deacetylase